MILLHSLSLADSSTRRPWAGGAQIGIAFDAQGRLYWTESMAHRVMRWESGGAAVFCQLSDDHVPDGMAFAAAFFGLGARFAFFSSMKLIV